MKTGLDTVIESESEIATENVTVTVIVIATVGIHATIETGTETMDVIETGTVTGSETESATAPTMLDLKMTVGSRHCDDLTNCGALVTTRTNVTRTMMR